MGRDNPDALLAKQKCIFKKVGLGYTIGKKQKAFKNFFNFVKAFSIAFTTCHYCMH